jgi:hypothetical protein
MEASAVGQPVKLSPRLPVQNANPGHHSPSDSRRTSMLALDHALLDRS